MVIDLDNEKGQMELSLHSALTEGAWLYIKEKEKSQEILDLRIIGANKGGILASIRGIPAFLPVSQLAPEHYPKVEGGDKKKILKKLKSFVGKSLSVKIINHNPEEEKIIISEKRAWEVLQRQKLQQYHVGDVIPVSVNALTPFGAFVGFGDHLDGLIHISEFPEVNPQAKDALHEPSKDAQITDPAPSTALKVGDSIDSKIIDIRGTRVFFSLKQK
jgi:small subunit ribosomal protein S1